VFSGHGYSLQSRHRRRPFQAAAIPCQLHLLIDTTELKNLDHAETLRSHVFRNRTPEAHNAGIACSSVHSVHFFIFLPEIAGSNDGRSVDDGTDKRPRPFVFDVFAEDYEGLVDDGQPPAKRWHRASSASSSVRTEQARIPPVVNLPHSTRTSPGRKRLWRVTNGRLSALSASDRHCRSWSTKSAWGRRGGFLRRGLKLNWCGGTERSSGQRPGCARGGRRGCRKRAAR
jgi:hypothetical protein